MWPDLCEALTIGAEEGGDTVLMGRQFPSPRQQAQKVEGEFRGTFASESRLGRLPGGGGLEQCLGG